jgi:hypothetical protein
MGQHSGQSPQFQQWRTDLGAWRDTRPQRPDMGFADLAERQAFHTARQDWRSTRPVRPGGMGRL